MEIAKDKKYFKSIFDSLPRSIFLLDIDYSIIDVNKFALNRIGLSKEEVIGQKCYSIHHGFNSPCDEHGFNCPFKNVLETGKPNSEKHIHTYDDGNEHHEEITMIPILKDDGTVDKIVESIKDVTELYEMDSELKVEKAINNKNKLLESIVQIQNISYNTNSEVEVATQFLDIAEKITGSEFGFIGEINKNGLLDAIIISNSGWDACKIPHDNAVKSINEVKIRGLFGEPIIKKKSIISNNPLQEKFYVGLPKGHPPLTSFLGVPIFQNEKIIGVVALGNKLDGYNQIDIENIETLTATFLQVFISKRYEVKLRKSKDDLELMVQLRTSSLLDINEKLKKEISIRERTEQSLKISEKRFKRIFNNAPVGMYWSTSNGEIKMANAELLKILGCDSAEDLTIKRKANDLYLLDEDYQTFRKIMRDEGIIYNFETKFKKKNGEIITVLESANLLNGIDGEEEHYEGIIQDITSQKIAEDKIQKLLQAVEFAPVSIEITNIKGIIEYVNPKFTEVTGYTFTEAIGENPSILKSGEQTEEYYKELWETILSGNNWSGEFYNKKKNGDFYWVSAIISPIKNEEGKTTHFVAIKEDITEKKKLHAELVEAKELAESADKLKSEFLAQISHEIRTPLNLITSYTSYLKDELKDEIDDDQQYSFRAIKNATSRIIRTVDLLINMSELNSHTYECYFNELKIVDDYLYPIYLEHKKELDANKIDFTLNNKSSFKFAFADEYSLNQIFNNLIENAITFTNDGEITITAYDTNDNKIAIDIKDTGIGISEDFLPHIFENFTQEQQGYSRAYDGNGLGLALVNGYAELNDIEIKVESVKNEGTCFTLIFNKTVRG